MVKGVIPDSWVVGTFLEKVVFDNQIVDYLFFVVLYLVMTVALKLVRKGILAVSQKIADKAGSELACFVIERMKLLFKPIEYFGVFYFCINVLVLHPYFSKTINVFGLIFIVYHTVRFLVSLIAYILEKKMEGGASPGKRQVLRSILPAINVVIWGMGIVFILSNLGFDISALVAGLGIGGIAIALAAQSMLGDVFSYMSILADKPFEIGDLLNVDGIMGRVDYIGIKTTRFTSVTGEKLVFSNSDLTKSRLRNYQTLESRRGDFTIGIVYESGEEVIDEVPKIIKSIVESVDKARLDRCHFVNYGNFSLNFQTVFWIDGVSEYTEFLDRQEIILKNIYKEFAKRNIEFAYPTQKLFLSNDEKEK